MACPTCDHTMQGISDGYFWCPRCGTLKRRDDEPAHTTQPQLTKFIYAQMPATPCTWEYARLKVWHDGSIERGHANADTR